MTDTDSLMLRMLLRSSLDPWVLIDAHEQIAGYNHAFADHYGLHHVDRWLSADERTPLRDAIPDRTLSALRRSINEGFRDRACTTELMEWSATSQDEYAYYITATPAYVSDTASSAAVRFLLLSYADITRLIDRLPRQ